jgi:hypothetical protein
VITEAKQDKKEEAVGEDKEEEGWEDEPGFCEEDDKFL